MWDDPEFGSSHIAFAAQEKEKEKGQEKGQEQEQGQDEEGECGR